MSAARPKKKRPAKSVRKQPRLAEELELLSLRLQGIFRMAFVIEMALRYQNADEDEDVALCVRDGVCSPLWEQAEKAQALSKRASKCKGVS